MGGISRDLVFCYQLLAFSEMFQKSENTIRWANDLRSNTCSRSVGSIISFDVYAVRVFKVVFLIFHHKHTA